LITDGAGTVKSGQLVQTNDAAPGRDKPYSHSEFEVPPAAGSLTRKIRTYKVGGDSVTINPGSLTGGMQLVAYEVL
jgi:hypothetical protein